MPQIGCLVIHGFAGDVHEVLPLAQALREQGYVVECPTLEGHGMGRKHLGKSHRSSWVRSAHEAYKRLQLRSDEIIVIGFSMGGLLAFHIASTYPVKQLVTINTPYYYWDINQAWRNLRGNYRPHARRYVNSLIKIPFRSMFQFRLLLAETKQLLPKIACPYLILQGQLDDTVKAISAEHLRQQVGTTDVQISYFPHSDHLLLKGPEAGQAIELILERLSEFPRSTSV